MTNFVAVALDLWRGTETRVPLHGPDADGSGDFALDGVARVIDQTFDQFRWRNVSGPGRINKQLRARVHGCVLSLDLDTVPQLQIRVRLTRLRRPCSRLRTGVVVLAQLRRISRAIAQASESGDPTPGDVGRALLIGG